MGGASASQNHHRGHHDCRRTNCDNRSHCHRNSNNNPASTDISADQHTGATTGQQQ